MSRFIDKLVQVSMVTPEPMGFRLKQVALPRPKIQLVASLGQENIRHLAESISGADAGLLDISELSSGIKTLHKVSKDMPDIPWGGRLRIGALEEELAELDADFVVLPASARLSLLENKVDKILEVEASLTEGLLRAVNELPIDAALVAGKPGEALLTWQHLMLFQRFAGLLSKPFLVSIPLGVAAGELQILWEIGVDGVVVEAGTEQAAGRLNELRQMIDKLTPPTLGRREKPSVLLPRIGTETSQAETEEVEEEEEEE